MNTICRKQRNALHHTYELSDEELVTQALLGWVDPYSHGAVEQAQAQVENVARGVAEILLALDREKVLALCEDRA